MKEWRFDENNIQAKPVEGECIILALPIDHWASRKQVVQLFNIGSCHQAHCPVLRPGSKRTDYERLGHLSRFLSELVSLHQPLCFPILPGPWCFQSYKVVVVVVVTVVVVAELYAVCLLPVTEIDSAWSEANKGVGAILTWGGSKGIIPIVPFQNIISNVQFLSARTGSQCSVILGFPILRGTCPLHPPRFLRLWKQHHCHRYQSLWH